MAFDFGPSRRLRKHGEFSQAQRLGRRVTTAHFVLLVAAQPPVSGGPAHSERAARPARLGVVVTRKLGTAVVRNRVKRLCRECFRSWPGLVPPGVDLVVIARPGAARLGLADVRAEWGGVARLLLRRSSEALARPAGPDHPPADGS